MFAKRIEKVCITKKVALSLIYQKRKTMKTLTAITPDQLNKKASSIQAKSWGFKSIADAKRNGYNTYRTSMSVKEIADTLKISIDEANRLADGWNYNGLVQRVSHADLNCIYFKNKY